jgi:voltage-gated potassium channel Kch
MRGLLNPAANVLNWQRPGFRKTTVIHGNALEPSILEEAGVAVTEAIVAVTNDDETNILGSLLAKRHGAQRAIALGEQHQLFTADHDTGC